MHIYLIFYDIADDRRRVKVAALLERWGYERLQWSVFTGLQPPEGNAALWKDLSRLMDPAAFPNDKICSLAVSRERFAAMQVLGNVGVDLDYLLGRRQVLLL